MRLLILFSLIVLIGCEEPAESENVRKRRPGFLLTSPRVFVAGENETVCISLHAIANPSSKILVDLKIKEKHHITSHILDTAQECFDIAVPKFRKTVKDAQIASLHVQIQLNGNIYSAHNHEPLLVYPNNDIVFVETDRSIYKPGDRVKIRILVLNHELKPPENHQIPIVKIINPSGMVVTIWEEVQTEVGLIQLEHQLVQDTMPGKWKIELNDVTKTFDVKDYILPRFKVTLGHPKSIYRHANSIQLSVCAVYSFGKKVHGNATLHVTYPSTHHEAIVHHVELHHGCARIKFTNHDLHLEEMANAELHLLAVVAEKEGGHVESTSGKSFITTQPYRLKFAEERNYFQPGIPYQGKLKAANHLISLHNEVVEICYNVAEEHVWNIRDLQQCTNFTFDHDNAIHFHVPPLQNNVLEILLYARAINHTNEEKWTARIYPDMHNDGIDAYFAVNRWYSPSSSYMYLERTNKAHSKCRSAQQFVVYYTTDKFNEQTNVTFYYMLKHRDNILRIRNITHTTRKYRTITSLNDVKNLVGHVHPYIKEASYIDKFVLKFKLDNRINSKSQLLVYHVLPNGETVAATLDIHVEKCLANKVEAKWSHYQLHPGEKATLEIKTAPNSLCALSAVDKSTSILSNTRALNVHSLLRRFVLDKPIRKSFKPNCIAHMMRQPTTAADSTTEDADLVLKRKKRFNAMSSQTNQFDSYEAINDIGVLVVTNLRLIFKPCLYEPSDLSLNHEHGFDESDFQVQSLTAYKDLHYDVQSEDVGTSIRSFFPETWLWELVPVRGETTLITRKVPHTITNWITNTLCVSQSLGIGLSQPSEISVFQPFFLKVSTPSAIKQMEILHVDVLVFNYFNYSVPVRTTLGDSNGMEFLGNAEEKNVNMCIPSQESSISKFRIKGTQLGKMTITLLAEIDSSYPGDCGPEVIIHRRDIVTKDIVVEPKGYPVSEIKSNFMCLEDSKSMNTTWDLKLPDDVVENSSTAKIVVNADLLGPTIQNLEKLLNVPTGCGEQIMSSLAPNLYILKYLNATNKLTPTSKHRIIRNLKIGNINYVHSGKKKTVHHLTFGRKFGQGYQRILDYIHKDGSFSAFGYHDPAGSMFLTAFVVKVLQQAKNYIYVDQKVLDGAIAWILHNQLENGCFATVSHVFHDMGGTSTENSTAALTSYVMISLLESGVELPETVSTNAKYCIKGHASPDKYSLALSTYALFLIGWHSEALHGLSQLLQVGTRDANLMWWESASAATTVELTGYVLLSLLYHNSNQHLVYANAVVRWLTTQRGSQGGFVTTQDTVVALDAMTRYAKYVTTEEPDVDVRITTVYASHELTLKRDETLKTKSHTINRLPTHVEIIANGRGCLLIQAYINYNLEKLMQSEAFQLKVDVSPVSTTDQCSVAQVSPCLSYSGPGVHSNMAVLEITMPSGYEPDRASLYQLTQANNSNVKRFEDNANQVILYFTELTNDPICVPFNINENSVVETRVDAIVKLYDYYNPELQVTQTYQIHNCQDNEIAPIPTLPGSAGANTTRKIDENALNGLVNDFMLDSDSEVRTKRQENTQGLNPKFVNRDYDMKMPEGMEGNVPMYTTPDKNRTT